MHFVTGTDEHGQKVRPRISDCARTIHSKPPLRPLLNCHRRQPLPPPLPPPPPRARALPQVQEAAAKAGVSPQEYVDKLSVTFRELSEVLKLGGVRFAPPVCSARVLTLRARSDPETPPLCSTER